ncbi:MAG TPA: phospholipase D-like domain-containing protein [Thermoanaerobaculia bacterium]|nr:phospholipase D-like domain-containing protein [Thermoanaerobaculia bacterium]
MTFSPRRDVLAFLILVAAGSQTRCTVIHGIVASEKREIYRFQADFGVEDPQFRRSLDTMNSTMIGGNSADLLENGDAIFPAMTADIRAAKTSVNLESYIFQPDDAGRQFAAAMIDAARRGVEVRLLIDAYGGKLGDLEEPLKRAGVNVREYRPIRLFSIYKIGKRTHRKLLIVDGKIGYTGGLGIDERWLGNARNTKEWRDTQVRVEGPVAAQMQAIFSEDWTYTTGEILAGDRFFPKIPPAGDVEAEAIKASRGDASSLPKMLYYMAIQSARKTIRIQNAYFLPDKQTRNALIRAVQRGVDVQVMVPGTKIDLPMVRLASRLHYGPLLEAGVKIFEYQPTMMHNKVFLVDGIFATIGSINFDQRSMGKNAEESLVFYDRAFADRVQHMFDDDMKRCRQVTHRTWSHRGLAARISELIFWIWEPYY